MRNRLLWPLFILLTSPWTTGCALTEPDRDFRGDMRLFVSDLSVWAKSQQADFLVIPQNGQELFTANGEPGGVPVDTYLAAIDGTGREDLYYGWTGDGRATPEGEYRWLEGFLDLGEDRGVEVLTIDYVDSAPPMDSADRARADDSLSRAAAKGYVAYPAPTRGLETIPAYPSPPQGVSTEDIEDLADAANFLYLIDPGSFTDKASFIAAAAATDYDMLIIDAYWDGNQLLDAADIAALKTKARGGSRLVVAYLSIGEAEDYRPYWQEEWEGNPPAWLAKENPHWPGNYKVRYWYPEWQDLIFGSEDSVLGQILSIGFDGAYLDIIDAFDYFE